MFTIIEAYFGEETKEVYIRDFYFLKAERN